MNHDMHNKIASKISDKLIRLCNNNKTEGKSLSELYSMLLDEKYYEYKSNIFPYIADQLASKGYEIVSINNFSIKKY